jgi:hypothetical protein
MGPGGVVRLSDKIDLIRIEQSVRVMSKASTTIKSHSLIKNVADSLAKAIHLETSVEAPLATVMASNANA